VKGETNKELFLYPGSYKVKLVKPGYLDAEKEIEVKEGVKNDFSFALIKNSGSLRLSITPSDAQVLLNKEDYGNQRNIELAPGKYKMQVQKAGYYDTTEAVEIKLGKTLAKTYSLRQKVGKLQFTIQPIESDVKLMSNDTLFQSWRGAKLIKDIPEGEYELVCSANGYEKSTKKVIVLENKITVDDVTLKRITSSLNMQPKIINYEIEKIFRGNKKYFITVLIRDNREHRVRINTDRLTEQLMLYHLIGM
jgi:uncharacterized membrane protein